jgi:hypothetical protein
LTSKSKWFSDFGKALEPAVLTATAMAVLVGLIGGLVAEGLLELIYLFTNLFFYGKWSFAITYPGNHHLGAWVILIPAVGGLLVGIMVHFWEPTLKGHGIPEAMEAVLVGKSKVRMRVGVLKPLATAFAIGTGGPHHPDRGSLRVDLRPTHQADPLPTAGTAGRGSGGGHGGDVHRPPGGNPGRHRTSAV